MAIKKLIEVALPLDAINEASAREKSIRHGHPSTLHLWWARRPLAAARAVIWASLVDDPSSHPEQFPTEEEQNAERGRLFNILEELVKWENSNNERVLDAAKAEIKRSVGEEPPPLLDPFAGGGAIPLEAQRLGLEAYAQDLNPVAVIINKAMIEIPPLFAGKPAVNPDDQMREGLQLWEGSAGLAADVKYYGNWMKEEAFKRIGYLYPEVNIQQGQTIKQETANAWLWTRTVKCPNPACGHTTILAKSFDLSKEKGKEMHVKVHAENGNMCFEVLPGKSERTGTVNRQGAVCIHCGEPISFDYIRAEGRAGNIGAKLMAIVTEGDGGKLYVSPTTAQENAAIVPFPDGAPTTAMPQHALGFNAPIYGLNEHYKLFTNRQLTMLTTLSDLVGEAQEQAYKNALVAGMEDDGVGIADYGTGAKAYGEAIGVYLAFLVDKLVDYHSSLCSWNSSRIGIAHMFSRPALPMVWDYAECNPFCSSSGSFDNMLEWILRCFNSFCPSEAPGCAYQFDAQSDNGMRNIMVSTDPPYYDNIGYADLSDCFYVWLRRSLKKTYPKLFATMLVPKTEELIATPHREGRGREGARDFFEEGMFRAFKQVFYYTREDIPTTIYYAFKQSETESVNNAEATASTGWETVLSALIHAGFSIKGTWPMRTERPNRNRAIGSNALASSIVLVCRKRSIDAPIATRREFVSALKSELGPALDKLQSSNIAPVDLAQSAIGPGIGVYSRYSKVVEADGTEMTVRSALQLINQELDIHFSEQDSDLDRESRFCVDLFTQNAFNDIKFGEADVLARAKNTSIEGLKEKGALFAEKGIVHLKTRDEVPSKINPNEQFIWLLTQQLTNAMQRGGITLCAQIIANMGGANAERVKALAYRLFTLADKKHWNTEAYAYNNLVVAWPEIQNKAAQLLASKPVQTSLFE